MLIFGLLLIFASFIEKHDTYSHKEMINGRRYEVEECRGYEKPYQKIECDDDYENCYGVCTKYVQCEKVLQTAYDSQTANDWECKDETRNREALYINGDSCQLQCTSPLRERENVKDGTVLKDESICFDGYKYKLSNEQFYNKREYRRIDGGCDYDK
ncbi:unnamed protein product [Gordionus sp. m RMFG-2023]